MSHLGKNIPWLGGLLAIALLCLQVAVVRAGLPMQQPTVSIPTVTGTPEGPSVRLNPGAEYVNLRSGPGQDYPVIGIMVLGQKAAVLGSSRGGEWLKIVYPGVPGGEAWVHYSLVTRPESAPVVDPPPTPTPRVTPTLNPTLEAQFAVSAPPTRLPTFTSPPPLVAPTFAPQGSRMGGGTLPAGLIIIGLAVVGLFGTMITLLRGR